MRAASATTGAARFVCARTLAAVLVVVAVVAGAGGARARPVPALSRRVTDEAAALSAGDVARLEDKLAAYANATGHQLAVLVIPSLDGEVLEQYSVTVAQQWRLGDKKRDDGLLLLVAMKEHAIRVEVGYGLEGAVTDVTAARVIREIIAPRFRSNDVAGGIEAGLDALMRAAQGESVGPAPSGGGWANKDPPGWLFWAILGFVALFLVARIPRLVRAPLLAGVGGLIGHFVLGSLLFMGVFAFLGFIIGIILPVMRSSARGGFGRGGYGGYGGYGGWGSSSSSSSSWSSSSSSSSGGGFSGGGGSFGGGGASGGW